MLKALELLGFKSFADKTRFEFPDGITIIVGPNGSGKSNVVDAIRWVLGEQSAKSLRGSEMADVIFKGSGNSQRRPANTAEVTIVFENAAGLLGVDSREVRVTRRVYRSGEGEYLINSEPCRLRDIRDLFRGTGVGTDAYSLIEQGKVDTLLQASPRERRAIFEEAAGISRFKAKKVESQRRLDRVEQNLLRLSDIVEEVERRLKSLRNQATKARRYKEYTQRLQELRTHVGLTDFRAISAEWQRVEDKLTDTAAELSALESARVDTEAKRLQSDQRLATIKAENSRISQRLSKNREAVTSLETSTQLHRKTLVELDSEKQKCRRKLAVVNTRAGNMQHQLRELKSELSTTAKHYDEVKLAARAADETLLELGAKIEHGRDKVRQQSVQLNDRLQATRQLTGQLSKLESELNVATSAIQRDQQRDDELKQQLDAAMEQAKSTESAEQRLKQQLEQASREHAQAQAVVSAHTSEAEKLKSELTAHQTQLVAASERSNVLEEVERRLEGIGAGTKDLLAQAQARPVGGLGEIRGMVADLIEVKVEMAPLIDAALGDRAQFIVVAGLRLVRAIADGSVRLSGRVGLISLSTLSARRQPLEPTLEREEGVLGRATDFVQVSSAWQDLANHLLGTTWLVRSLDVAIFLREKYKQSPWRYVTSAGEVLEADGTVLGGPRLSSGGIVSRRSELRSLRAQIKRDTEQVSLLAQAVARQRDAQREAEQRLLEWTDDQKRANNAYAEVHAKAEAARQWVQQSKASYESLQGGLTELRSRHAQLSTQQAASLSGLDQLEQFVSALEKSLNDCQSRIAELEQDRQTRESKATATKIELAKVEQRLETLRTQAMQCEQDNYDRAKAVADIQTQLDQCQSRQRDVSRAILQASSELAEYYLHQQRYERELRSFRHEEDRILAERHAGEVAAKSYQEQLQRVQKTQHSLQMQSGELRMKRDAVAERLREDYGIELADSMDELHDQGERSEIEKEIGELRRKISNIGAVNMESLAELEDLEERFGSLSAQYDDLIQAKESLERIIQRINIDSRRMFVETLDAIRAGFQSLFRRAFGGGQADIVVEENVDILDAGVDIVATPPGKHSLNISLLSGGERALTAVTLLLAIFRHRPSPFCILDEVDGPLDEANIGRFVDVLKEFLETTKVVIVTHSKKTMSAATTLYGVTMQESGVSKRVSVQFNDVSDDGTILAHSEEEDSSNDGEAA